MSSGSFDRKVVLVLALTAIVAGGVVNADAVEPDPRFCANLQALTDTAEDGFRAVRGTSLHQALGV